ncbi:hypothetical protein GCM10027071_11090 [Microbacterium marinum]
MRPLPIHPWSALTPERGAMLRAAKAALDVPFLIQPSPAASGSPGRVLGWGQVPPFLSESVIIPAGLVDDADTIFRALRHLLAAPAGSPGILTEEQWMSAAFGGPVTYVGEEDWPPPAVNPWDRPREPVAFR